MKRYVYSKDGTQKAIISSLEYQGVFMGLRPVVVGLIASAALLLMNKENFGSETVECVKSILICVVTFFFAHFTKVHPILLIIVAGLAGYFIF